MGMANGLSKIDSRPALILLNKKTFIHSGLSSLLSAIYNQNELIAVILETDPPGEDIYPITALQIVQGIGIEVDHIWCPPMDNVDELSQQFEQAINTKGVRVIIPQ